MIEKLQGRDMVNTHAVAKKVNEIIEVSGLDKEEEKLKVLNEETMSKGDIGIIKDKLKQKKKLK